uniref:Uncharacterized protein n=1 Tax=Pararge aegeria TaxID=116150 RepID=S4PAD4_9NEOP
MNTGSIFICRNVVRLITLVATPPVRNTHALRIRIITICGHFTYAKFRQSYQIMKMYPPLGKPLLLQSFIFLLIVFNFRSIQDLRIFH